MHTPIRQRQLQGLVLHHRGIRQNTQALGGPHGLVGRTTSGICRWCYERTTHFQSSPVVAGGSFG